MMIKTPEELAAIREGGHVLADILRVVAHMVRPGVSTFDLDEAAERLIRERGGESAFKGYQAFGAPMPYPATLCTSINDEVVHGIPDASRILKEGDIIGLDIGMKYKGMYTDTAVSVPVGTVDARAEKLIHATKVSLDKAIACVKDGAYIGDIGHAVESYIEGEGFGVVRDLVGHGVGYEAHEDPQIPNFGRRGTGMRLKEGMVIALEPMVTEGTWRVVLADDGWTWRTKDGSRAAHFEHTMIVTKRGAEVVTL